MKPNTSQLLGQGLLTLFVVSAALAAYDRLVLRPALVIGVVDVDLAQAKEACAARGHALCASEQWQRACHGASDWTYPYGPKREAGRCRVGDENAAPAPGGADPHCVTPEGVLDLVGNVAEWTADGDVLGGSVRSPKDSGCDTKQRQKAKSTSPVVGFRCCALLPAGSGGG